MTEIPVDPVADVVPTLGEQTIRELVAAFYRRIPTDDVIGPMYPPEDYAGAEQRLGDFLVQRFGGPSHYSKLRGHPRLRMRHAPFAVTTAASNRWMMLMTAAMDEVAFDAALRPRVEAFLAEVATFLVNR